MIIDSGNRTTFSTGAVRDLKGEDKGRCDLLPIDTVAIFLNDIVLMEISLYQQTNNVDHIAKAISMFMDENYIDEMTAILELSRHFKEGAEKYGPYNWQKGIPEYSYIDSSVRHYLKHRRGDKDEPHDRAFLWNLFCLWWTHEHIHKCKDCTHYGKEDVFYHKCMLKDISTTDDSYCERWEDDKV